MKQCFVISPIGPEGSETRKDSDDVFDYIIKPAMDECNIKAFRSDHVDKPGKITDQMFQAIYDADLCIADLTNHNPNVFYELAIAQSANRPVIILIHKNQVLPFDVIDLRCVYYDLQIHSFQQKTYITRLISIIKEFELMNWNVPDLFASYRLRDNFTEKIEEGVKHGLAGAWEGEVEQYLDGEFQTLDLKMELKVTDHGFLIGEGEVKLRDIRFDLIFQGTYKSSRFLKLDYQNSNKAILQFGTFVLRLTDDGVRLVGSLAGYGQISGKIISGTLKLNKVFPKLL